MVTFNANIPADGRRIAGYSSDRADFTATLVARDRLVTPAVNPDEVTVDDAVYLRHTPATVAHEFDVVITGAVPGTLPTGVPQAINLTPGVATITDQLVATRVTDGLAEFILVGRGVRKRYSFAVSQAGGQTVDVFQHFVTGSLARHCVDDITARIAGHTFASTQLFSVQNDTAHAYAWNASGWFAGIDLTCVAAYNTSGGRQQMVTAITPQDVIGAEHFAPSVGATVYFPGSDSTTVARQIVAGAYVGPSNDADFGATDLWVGHLDEPLPATVTPASLAPSDLEAYLPSAENRVPGLIVNQDRRALVLDLVWVDGTWATFFPPVAADRLAVSQSIRPGDSGCPGFIVANGEAVLLNTSTMPGAGPDLQDNVAGINASLVTVGSSYEVTQVSFAGFPTN